MAQIARRPGDEEEKHDQDDAGEPVDPNELVVEGPDGRRLVVRLPEIRPPREPAPDA
jgi:hypothetical protein